jgi:hypothetical protein
VKRNGEENIRDFCLFTTLEMLRVSEIAPSRVHPGTGSGISLGWGAILRGMPYFALGKLLVGCFPWLTVSWLERSQFLAQEKSC